MKFEIKSRYSGNVLFECEAGSLRIALEMAVSKSTYLEGAYLKGAYLKGADLKGADLEGAYLKGADLEGADLKGAYLEGAYLEGAYLEGAYLKGAYLKGANLEGANLEGANLEGAYLKGADLEGAKLDGVKNDYFKVLSVAKAEVVGLYKALLDGRIHGSAYTGECACLVGTIANVRGESHESLGIDLRPHASRPAERWFLGIDKGDTPESNQVSAITKSWTEEFANENGIKLPTLTKVWSE